jgi:hypothetical protein
MRLSVEILANEVIAQRLNGRQAVYEGPNRVDPRELTTQCLRYLYRLIVLLYAESRPELAVVPIADDAYVAGYSLDRLRELVLVDLLDDHARNGRHFDDSLRLLFDLVNNGYHADHLAPQFTFSDRDDPTRSFEEYLEFPGLDATIFDAGATPLLDGVTLRNEALQRVLALLMLNREAKGKNDQRGFVSYAQLGINQLGAVYEGLMAYSGFFADRDLYEVAKDGDPSDGTWVVPVDDADSYPDNVFVMWEDPITGRRERVQHKRGMFVFRLAGRDRQRSASYYTPEVLTSCVVRHALAELLGTDDYARVPGGCAGITEARQILDLTICEPALGSGAFLNEAINQLAAEYLRRRQAELGETLDAEEYQRELQKVKSHFALHQCYGVDLNATAIELAEVSLWLNCMHPGLKAPWFGLQLRRGNSLIGCRRATWRAKQLKDKVWAKDRASNASPPVDRPLTEALDDDEIHHFLLPGHGWGIASGRKEAKELAPRAAKALAEWRKTILNTSASSEGERLRALAAGVERLWVEATDLLTRLSQRMHRPLGLYGSDDEEATTADDRRAAEAILTNPNSALGRLRLLMDAWTGLWFWTLDDDVAPPSWGEWLNALELLVGAEPEGPTGQLDMFVDLAQLAEIEEVRAAGRTPVVGVLSQHAWLPRARDLARAEAAWHWELEFAPVFRRGGFDLQVGNPPWVRPIWQDDLVLAEDDAWFGLAEKPSESERSVRRARTLGWPGSSRSYLSEVASHEGNVASLASPQLRPLLTGIQTNLYMVFIDVVWRHASAGSATCLLHPESHFADPAASRLREAAYRHLRRHLQFDNELFLFEEVSNKAAFGVHVYGEAKGAIAFFQLAYLKHPSVADDSLIHDGSGDSPGIQYPAGGWDLRPHRTRVVAIDEHVLGEFASLFDDPGTPPEHARLLRPVTRLDLEALSVLAEQPDRLGDHPYLWTAGWHEGSAKKEGFIKWETKIPESWDEVILQGPHFTIATPFAKEPLAECKHNKDYRDWDLESLPESVIPRTLYQRACGWPEYQAGLGHWNGEPYSRYTRVTYREMTQPGLERSLHPALYPAGPAHVGSVVSVARRNNRATALWAALLSSLPYDYLIKVSGTTHVNDYVTRRLPAPSATGVDEMMLLRVLRLNCLTSAYSELWRELFRSTWASDRWTTSGFTSDLGEVSAQWSVGSPLRKDAERRYALVELDALAAVALGLSTVQLCTMYSTQFAVLRKYESTMAFDARGRRICAHHYAQGLRQLQLQDAAKNGEQHKRWTNVWKLFEQFEEDPDSVDWEGHYTPPFTRPDREAEMTRAYVEFKRRLDAGKYA